MRIVVGRDGTTVAVDHDEGQVVLWAAIEQPLSMSPCEAKALATLLTHYADRAQHIRDQKDASPLQLCDASF